MRAMSGVKVEETQQTQQDSKNAPSPRRVTRASCQISRKIQ